MKSQEQNNIIQENPQVMPLWLYAELNGLTEALGFPDVYARHSDRKPSSIGTDPHRQPTEAEIKKMARLYPGNVAEV